jgi:hypothetical protein
MDMIIVQQQVATAILADNPISGWERIVVDAEIDEEPSGYRIDTVSFAVVRGADAQLSMPDFDLSDATRQSIIKMYRERIDNTGDKMGSFGLEIDPSGKYDFKISYDKPDRLNGDFDSKRQYRINNYLATYKK